MGKINIQVNKLYYLFNILKLFHMYILYEGK